MLGEALKRFKWMLGATKCRIIDFMQTMMHDVAKQAT